MERMFTRTNSSRNADALNNNNNGGSTTTIDDGAGSVRNPNGAGNNAKSNPILEKYVKAVNEAKPGPELKKAVKELYAAVYSGKHSTQACMEAGVAHACVRALDVDPKLEFAFGSLRLLDEKDMRITFFSIPRFKEIMSQLAMVGDSDALALMWNCSDTEQLAFTIVTIPGFIEKMLELAKGPASGENKYVVVAALSVIRNLSMFPASQPELLKHSTIIDTLMLLSTKDATSTKATMALANLVGKDEVKSELLRATDSKALLSIVDILKGALGKLGSGSRFALYEPLLSLRYLSIPQKNRSVLGEKLLPMLPDALNLALSTNDAVSASHSVAIISQFAFDADSLIKLKSNKELAQAVEMVISQSALQPTWSSAANEAQGLLWTLRGGDEQLDNLNLAVLAKRDQVMISYNWTHKSIATKVAAFLKQNGYRVWQDVEHMKENIMESMARGVLESSAIIILVSPQYKESANCQREAMLSAKRNKQIIPLLVVDGYSGDGWLELFISPLMYYDVSTNFDETMKQVLKNELKADEVSIPKAIMDARSKMPTTVEEVADFIRSCQGLEDIAGNFPKQEIDGEGLRAMFIAWNNGKLSYSEVKDWFEIPTVGKVLKLKSYLNALYQN